MKDEKILCRIILSSDEKIRPWPAKKGPEANHFKAGLWGRARKQLVVLSLPFCFLLRPLLPPLRLLPPLLLLPLLLFISFFWNPYSVVVDFFVFSALLLVICWASPHVAPAHGLIHITSHLSDTTPHGTHTVSASIISSQSLHLGLSLHCGHVWV